MRVAAWACKGLSILRWVPRRRQAFARLLPHRASRSVAIIPVRGVDMARFSIGRLVLDTVAHEVFDGDRPLGLEPRVYELLVFLLENRDRPVPKEELLDEVWRGRAVTEGVLTQAVAKLRRALGGESQAFVRTLHRVGYRYVGPARPLEVDATPIPTVFLVATDRSDVERYPNAASALRAALAARRSGAGVGQGIAAVEADADEGKRHGAVGLARRLSDLALPGQILLTAPAFDFARVAMDPEDGERLSWLAHGTLPANDAGLEVMVFEVGESGQAPLTAPPGLTTEGEAAHIVPGWRAAHGLAVPERPNWELESSLGAGGYGEAWLAVHTRTGEPRVFKFCYDADRVRSLQREVTLFRLLRESLGNRDDIARILDWNFTTPPYFVESEFSSDGDLAQWAERQGGIANVDRAARLDVLAKIAIALSAAHVAGVLHKDIKPQNILIRVDADGVPQPALSDFGVGLLTDHDSLRRYNITQLGLTAPLGGDPASLQSGTPRYAAPELLEGGTATRKSDIYSLGILLYQLWVGDLDRVVAPGWAREVDDPVLQGDLRALLDRDPERRPSDAATVAEWIHTLPARRSSLQAARAAAQRRRRGIWLATSVLVVAALATATFWPREPEVVAPSPGLRAQTERIVAIAVDGREPPADWEAPIAQAVADALHAAEGIRTIADAVFPRRQRVRTALNRARELDADYVLLLRMDGAEQLEEVEARLIVTGDGSDYWRESFTQSPSALALQQSLTTAVRRAVLKAPATIADYQDIDEDAVFGKLAMDQRRWFEAYERLRGADPTDPRDTRTKSLAELMTILGYLRRAETLYEQALASERTDVQVMNQKAAHLYEVVGNDEKMLARAEAAARAGSGRAGFYVAAAALRRGEIDVAIAAQTDALNRLGNRSEWVEPIYRAIGDRHLLTPALDYLRQADAEQLMQEKQFFLQYGILGATEDALRALERGLAQPEFILTFVWLPEMAHVRRTPRFQDLMARYGLIDFWRVHGAPDRCEPAGSGFRCL